MTSARTIHMFATVATADTPPDFSTEVDLPPGWPQRQQTQCERLWRLRTSAIGIQRFTAGALSPIQLNEFNRSELPAGASEGGSGFFKVLLKIGSTTGATSSFMIDVGETLEIYAFRVDMSLIGPTGAVEVTPGNRNTLENPGLVVDVQIGASLLAIEESIDNRDAKLTQHLSVLQNTQGTISVPRGAVSLRIIQGIRGSNSGNWTRHVGDPAILATTFTTGTIAFLNRASTESHSAIGDETHLQTDQNNASDRFFTLVWTIRP